SPANFGMVMATGIVSLAAWFLHYDEAASTLFYLNNVLYGVLCSLFALRLLRYPKCFFHDMFSYTQGPAFFTFVAGTSVLAAQYIIMYGRIDAGFLLLVVGTAAWLVLTYTV